MVDTYAVLRVLLALTFALSVNSTCCPQAREIPREHSCEGECSWGWDVPACESAWHPNINAVFLGRAAAIRKEDVPILLDGEKALTERLFVTFEVEEAFLGVTEKTVSVTSGGDLCGFPFSRGNEYLIYGRRLPSGEVYVSICSATKWKKEAAEDLKYLRDLANAPRGGTIYGTAFRFKAPENPRSKALRGGHPATGQSIEIHGPDQNYEVIVDAQGKFTISPLPPGLYTVSVNSDGAVTTSRPQQSSTIDLADKGCARFNFWIDPFAKKQSDSPGSGALPPTKQKPGDERPN